MMELIVIESGAFQELQSRLRKLSATMTDFCRKAAPPIQEKWLDSQEVCLALNLSKCARQTCRDKGIVSYSNIGGKFFYKETDIREVLQNGWQKR